MPQFCDLRKVVIGIATAAICVACASVAPAKADIERFPYTYEWFTPSKGELELGVKHTQPASARNWQDQYELEYGATDRYAIEGYVVYNKSGGFRDVTTTSQGDADDGGGGVGSGGSSIFDPIHNGEAYRYGGFQIEQRYRFGDYAQKKVLVSGYVEYENYRDIPAAVEAKAILQYDPNRRTTFAFNLITTSPLANSTSTAWGYNFGGAYIGDKNRKLWYGGEALGNFSSSSHYFGPTLGYSFDDATRIVGTYAKQYQGSGGDQFRILVSHELN